jgi:CRISPR-associated protein Csd2
MGGKATVAYGLYRAHGFVSPHLATGEKGTGFSDTDLELFWEALAAMFDHDHSAARGMMATRRLTAFRHASALGNARASDLFARVAAVTTAETPRSYSDYVVSIDNSGLPQGMEVLELV